MSNRLHSIIVDFSDGSAREFKGLECLANAIAYADERNLRIRVISHPASIMRDLQGSRARHLAVVGSKYPKSDHAYNSPESRMLRAHARLDLLEIAEPASRCWPQRLTIKHRRQQMGDE